MDKILVEQFGYEFVGGVCLCTRHQLRLQLQVVISQADQQLPGGEFPAPGGEFPGPAPGGEFPGPAPGGEFPSSARGQVQLQVVSSGPAAPGGEFGPAPGGEFPGGPAAPGGDQHQGRAPAAGRRIWTSSRR